ncbi:hypothetical protein [Saccharolobus shibatae]|uniref:Uncharacterized protein n=1 Tax=Saccharolobus shibatae TaxID=2286 RepID=A0A8F5BV23_9CREN|nr:hypothetical protein [Saccharolobus shibatae]QXJ32013.1 hypothetical protein J5U21_01664 [Saccharolobus shibatae]
MYYIRETLSEGKPKLHYYQVSQENRGFKVFKASLSLSELNDILLSKTDIKFGITKKTVTINSERLFKMAVIYGGVRQTMRKYSVSRFLSVSKVLISMEEFSLQFWYTEFISRFSHRNNVVDAYKVGRAFRDLYEL